MFFMRVAELLVQLDNWEEQIQEKCAAYLVEEGGRPDIVLRTDDTDIAKGMQILWLNKGETDPTPGEAEIAVFDSKFYPLLPAFGAKWFHATLVELEGYGYAFTAPSGYGKTTHARLWLKHFGDKARIINGDNPIIRRRDEKFYGYGTPFCGEEGYNVNTAVPLRGLCYLNHGEHNVIRRMDPAVAFGQLLREYSWQITERSKERYMELLQDFVEKVPVYQLTCNMDEEAAQVAYEGMRNGWED